MRARQLFRYRAVRGGVTLEMMIWALPQVSAERPHGLKYRHHGEREEAYRFESLEKLLDDFRDDCVRLAGWRWE